MRTGLLLAIGAAGAALAGCSPDSAAIAGNAANEAPAAAASTQVAGTPAADAPLGEWLVGAWSFDTSCATDFIIRYDADGKLDNAGEVGSWKLDGAQLTETLVERFENGGEAPVKLDPPVTRSYSVRRIDAGHGSIAFEGRDVPIQRC